MDELSPQPMVDGELLRAFLAFSRTLNFTRAAKLVGLSQPAFFERVKRLADLAGGPLYAKKGRALSLTPLGERMAALAHDALQLGRAFRATELGEHQPEVILAAGEGAYLYLLGPALSLATERARGQFELTLLTLGGPAACEAVRTGAAHLAVAAVDVVPRGLESEDLCTTPLCLAVSSRSALAKRKAIELKELTSERLILAPEGQRHRDHVGRALLRLGQTGGTPLEADGWPLMLAFAQAGLGVAVVNGTCHPPRGLALVPIPELGSVTYRLLWRRGARLPEGAHRLREWLVESMP